MFLLWNLTTERLMLPATYDTKMRTEQTGQDRASAFSDVLYQADGKDDSSRTDTNCHPGPYRYFCSTILYIQQYYYLLSSTEYSLLGKKNADHSSDRGMEGTGR